jgi:hypothetical protein
MIEYDSLEEFRDPQTYDLVDEGYYDDWPLTEQWPRKATRSQVWISRQR